jgi:diguanylate cyclase (GGDEF)-like protein
VQILGHRLGIVATQITERIAAPHESGVVALVAGEIALPIRTVALLEESKRLAATDVLTGLANRRHGSDTLARELARAERYRHGFCVALVDIDHFKRVNDTLGHSVGDRVLAHVARVLRQAVRKSDLVARWGGEEFLLLLTSTPTGGARFAAERIRAAVAASPFIDGDGNKLEITISIGVAMCQGQNADALIDAADRALYRAKSAGRNRVEVATDE